MAAVAVLIHQPSDTVEPGGPALESAAEVLRTAKAALARCGEPPPSFAGDVILEAVETNTSLPRDVFAAALEESALAILRWAADAPGSGAARSRPQCIAGRSSSDVVDQPALRRV